MAGADAKLVWETVVSGTRPDQTPSRLHVLVDARTGKVVRTNDEVSTFAAEGAAHAAASKVGAAARAAAPTVAGTGQSIYSGRVPWTSPSPAAATR